VKENEFDFQKRLKNNIRILCEKQNIKIGSLEKQLELSSGYFSREFSKVSCFKLCKIAEILKVDAYDLMKVDLGKLIELNKGDKNGYV